MLTGNQIREKFLQYFAEKGHERIKSANLVPQNDPTLYFANAGMVPFKGYFTGEETPAVPTATTSQKCMRVSGKHNDLENVGRTARHHTFFEMLGNFSFGDYFKKEAIAYAWEFLTEVVKIPKDRLWVTVYQDDDEAYEIWAKQEKVPEDRILRLDEKDNFWAMGDTGPCGPCSEIHYQYDSATPFDEKNVVDWFNHNSDNDHIIEIWNLVFMQFEQKADGSRVNLPKPSIDTGMGLERLACVLQDVDSNYDTDFFTPLLKHIEKIVQKTYGKDEEEDFSMRVLADHIRSTAFLISDGVLPSNEGRGYVLRRIMRRAIRHGKLLGQTHPFFHKLIPTLVKEMAEAYPDLKTNQGTLEKVTQAEEERFFATLDKGLKILNEEIAASKGKVLAGNVAFKLYDTFGFPLDLTEIIVNEKGMSVDHKGFEAEMAEQKERARAGWKGTDQEKVNEVYRTLAEKHQTEFLGYDTLETPAKVVALVQDDAEVSEVSSGDCELVLDKTPFYAESGGQVGDKGVITAEGLKAQVVDTQKPADGLFVHSLKNVEGTLKVGGSVQSEVFREVRKSTMRNHSCTHLMHEALRKILGDHVRQAGSFVSDQMLRLDFSHFEAIPAETLRQIEDEVNAEILKNLPITKSEMSYDDAIEAGALAFFGDKYGDVVRVVKMGDYSVELCGGTHLDRTSEIGAFKIISESSIAAGVRRVEAITGEAAVNFMQDQAAIVSEISQKFKAAPEELVARVDKQSEQIKTLEKEIQKLKSQLLRGGSVDYTANAIEANGVKAVYHKSDVDNAKDLQEVAQVILEKLGSGVVVVGAEIKGKASLLVMVSKDTSANHPANQILNPLAELIGGRGGGKAERAQAGGPDVSGLDKIQDKLPEVLA